MIYQGPEYEDPNPPPEEEITNKKKANAKPNATPEEPEPRMIKPEPIRIENEHGRVFQIELGKFE
jgi:hypothetical protein